MTVGRCRCKQSVPSTTKISLRLSIGNALACMSQQSPHPLNKTTSLHNRIACRTRCSTFLLRSGAPKKRRGMLKALLLRHSPSGATRHLPARGRSIAQCCLKSLRRAVAPGLRELGPARFSRPPTAMRLDPPQPLLWHSGLPICVIDTLSRGAVRAGRSVSTTDHDGASTGPTGRRGAPRRELA